MADAKFNLSSAPLVAGKIGIKYYESSSPGAEVASAEYNPPHTAERQIIQPGLNPVPHIIRIYDTPGFPTLGTLLHEFWFDVRSNSIDKERRFYTGGGAGAQDPAADQNTLSDPYLDGKTISGVFKEGYRYLMPTQEYVENPGGGIILQGGIIFSGGEVWCIEVDYAAAAPANNSANVWAGIDVKTSDYSIVLADFGRVISAESATARIALTMPATAGVPNGKTVKVISYRGSQINASIRAQGADQFVYNGSTQQAIHLGMGEYVTIMKSGSLYYVIDEKSQHESVGQIVYADKPTPNTIKCEGQTLSRLDYPRLWAYVNSLGANTVDDATWLGNPLYSGLFSRGDNTSTFRLPDLRGVFLRGLDGTRGQDPDRATAGQNTIPGYYQIDRVGPHKHKNVTAYNAGHGSSSTPIAGQVALLVTGGATPGGQNGTIKDFNSGDVVANQIDTAPNSETRPKNVTRFALIKF